MDYEDPGWGASLRALPSAVLPWLAFGRRSRLRTDPPLVVMRMFAMLLPASLLALLVLLWFLGASFTSPERGWVAAVVGVVGLLSLVRLLSRRYARPRWTRAADQRRLGFAYRADFFNGIGMAHLPAVIGLVGVFVARSLWMYLVGLAFSAVDFVLIAPTRGEIERRQRQLQEAGSNISLGRALTQPPERAG